MKRSSLPHPVIARTHDKAIPGFPIALLIAFAMVLSLLQSCSLLRSAKAETEKNQQSTASSNQRKLDATRILNTNQRVFEWKLDSTNTQSILQIWPKGQFTFSPVTGFKGEAEKIQLVSGTQRSAAALNLKDSLANTTEQLNTETAYKATNQQQHTNTVKTETPSFWLITGLAVLAFAGTIIYKTFKT